MIPLKETMEISKVFFRGTFLDKNPEGDEIAALKIISNEACHAGKCRYHVGDMTVPRCRITP